ncbi:MAG: Na/Pi cotransporter family protein [Planctomycetota bacterium]|jgi:phosphate:Na+ symporter
MLTILTVLGGVALILFGVRFLRKGLDRLVGPRLPIWVDHMTGGVFRSAGTGLVMGLVAPSTTTQGLLTVTFVRRGLLKIHRAIVMVMGAYVGATLLVHIVAANLSDYVPVGLLAGVLLYQMTRSRGSRGVGQVVIAICLAVQGVSFIRDALSSVSESADLQELVELASRYPWLTVLLGAICTISMQSATAALSVIIALAITNEQLMLPEFIGAYLVGVNLGLSSITMIAGWRTISARRFSVAVLICRLILAIVLVQWVRLSQEHVDALPGTLAQRIAVAHTMFNLMALALAMVLATPLAWIVGRVVPEPDRSKGPIVPREIDSRWASDPHMAFAQTKREIGMAVRVTSTMLRDAWKALGTRDQAALRSIRQRDDTVDNLERFVKRFLTRQLTDELGPTEVKRRLLQLRFVGDLEAIADVVDKRICDAALRACQRGVRFSEAGWEELRELFEHVSEMLDLAGATFTEESPELAQRLLVMKDEIRDQELMYRERHYTRLQDGLQETIDTTGLHLELMSQLKHIAHVAAGVAYGVEQVREKD